MKSRPLAFALLFAATLLMSGCCWCRPCGHWGHHCCYPDHGPEAVTPPGGAEVRTLAVPARPVRNSTTLY
jgi:hypothetical protein